MAKILLVEDDCDLAEMTSHRLSASGHIVEIVHDGQQALDFMKTEQYELVVLDWNLPNLSGLDILKDYRNFGGKSAILMLTTRSAMTDKIAGFDHGADDYLPKPFDMRELISRIQSLLRRPPVSGTNELKVLDLELNPTNHMLKRGGSNIHLQRQDFALLEFLIRHKGEAFSAESLIARVWHSESSASINGLRMAMVRLRKAIDTPGQESLIENVPRVGYRIRSDRGKEQQGQRNN
jgi:two-component system, OmpR family, manganese sensing response regulator